MNGCEFLKCVDWHDGRCNHDGECWHRESSEPSSELLAMLVLLRKVHDEIDALDEGIPMSADTWDEMEDVLKSYERGGVN